MSNASVNTVAAAALYLTKSTWNDTLDQRPRFTLAKTAPRLTSSTGSMSVVGIVLASLFTCLAVFVIIVVIGCIIRRRGKPTEDAKKIKNEASEIPIDKKYMKTLAAVRPRFDDIGGLSDENEESSESDLEFESPDQLESQRRNNLQDNAFNEHHPDVLATTYTNFLQMTREDSITSDSTSYPAENGSLTKSVKGSTVETNSSFSSTNIRSDRNSKKTRTAKVEPYYITLSEKGSNGEPSAPCKSILKTANEDQDTTSGVSKISKHVSIIDNNKRSNVTRSKFDRFRRRYTREKYDLSSDSDFTDDSESDNEPPPNQLATAKMTQIHSSQTESRSLPVAQNPPLSSSQDLQRDYRDQKLLGTIVGKKTSDSMSIRDEADYHNDQSSSRKYNKTIKRKPGGSMNQQFSQTVGNPFDHKMQHGIKDDIKNSVSNESTREQKSTQSNDINPKAYASSQPNPNSRPPQHTDNITRKVPVKKPRKRHLQKNHIFETNKYSTIELNGIGSGAAKDSDRHNLDTVAILTSTATDDNNYLGISNVACIDHSKIEITPF